MTENKVKVIISNAQKEIKIPHRRAHAGAPLLHRRINYGRV